MPIRIGTRKSPLALAQAAMARRALLAADAALDETEVIISPMLTSGDVGDASAAAQWGLKGLFTKELEEAMLRGDIDIAVHSMKDVPSVLPEGLMIGAMLPREDARDAFISRRYASLEDLPEGGVVGTSSTRRGAQLRRLRPDIVIVPFRGNVGTRLAKLEAGEVDATLLAVAGLNRLSQHADITSIIDTGTMLPAVAQGAVGIECRSSDDAMLARLSAINHPETFACVSCERSLLRALDGSCRSPIAAYACFDGHYIVLNGQLLAADGSDDVKGEIMAPIADGERIGHALGLHLKHTGAHLISL